MDKVTEENILEVFSLLRKNGPLCTSQISAVLLLSLTQVTEIVEELRNRKIIRPHSERPNKSDRVIEPNQIPWKAI